MRVVIAGAGFGGLELTTRLSDEFGDDVDIVLIDRSDGFVFGFSKLDVMFGRADRRAVRCTPTATSSSPACGSCRPTIALDRPGRQAGRDRRRHVRRRHPGGRARRRPGSAATPGLLEGGHEFYTVAGAFALARRAGRLRRRPRRSSASRRPPFKCPPAPSETALLLHDYLSRAGTARVVDDLAGDAAGRADPAVTGGSQALLAAFAERGIDWHPSRLVARLDPDRKVALLSDGDELPYDLFLGVPVHRAPAGRGRGSGLTVDGWIPVDPLTLETSFPGVYAVGDVTSVGTPKAGVFAEGQAIVVADADRAHHAGRRAVDDVRRPRHLLPRVRPRRGRQGRRHVPAAARAGR